MNIKMTGAPRKGQVYADRTYYNGFSVGVLGQAVNKELVLTARRTDFRRLLVFNVLR